MKTEIRTPVALLLLAFSATSVAQNTQTPQPDAQPPQPPQPAAQAPQPPPPAAPAPQPTPPAATTPAPPPAATPVPPPAAVAAPPPAGSTVPQSPPPPRYPPSQQQIQSPPAPQYSPPPPPPPPQHSAQPQWAHSESSYNDSNVFRYHPFRFHIDGGGTITQRSSEDDFKNGWNVGAGFTWYPTSHLPLGLRVDGTYNEFRARNLLLQQASDTYMTRVDNGTERIWGGDTDLELDLHFSPHVHGYLLAGGGWYKSQTTFRQRNYSNGYDCYWFGCGPGYYGSGIVARYNTDWHFARNAGLGLEFAMGPIASFFVEARYMRIDPNDAKSDFIPIKAGVRF